MNLAESLAPPVTAWSPRYRAWLLALLVLTYAFAFVDRIVIATVGQALKLDLQLSDTQLGLLGGLAFALFYTVLGIPIARLAERASRVNIICVSLGLWSAMTALCGSAASFVQLLLFRIGVGVGEAGCTPSAHSLIADHFPAQRRATAYGIFSLGVPLGVLLGATSAGWLVQHHGWRSAFVVLGLPGIVLALLMKLTLREPPRGLSEGMLDAAAAPSLGMVFRRLASLATFRHAALGLAFGAFGTFGINLFLPIFFTRVFGMSFAQAGLAFGLISGISGLAGNALGGWLADRAGRADVRWYLWLPALGFLCSTPLFILGVLQTDWRWAAAIMLGASVLFYLSHPPTFAVVHSFVGPRARATASSLLLLLLNLVGQGLGPLFMGSASDYFARRSVAGTCPAPAGDDVLAQACAQANASGIRSAMVACSFVFLLSALHYALAARALRRERQHPTGDLT